MDHLHTYIMLLVLFCSPWPSAGTAFLTHLETQCLEDCKPDGGEYKCRTIDKDGRSQTMYCSPQENMDYWGRQCRETGDGTVITSHHCNKRAQEVIDTVDDKVNHLKITFYADPAPIADGNKWKAEAENIINQWNNGNLRTKAGTLIESGDLRLDMQGTFKRNNQLYYNLQIQINKKRKPGESTTISQILVPDGVPEVYVRRAFRESFTRRAKVTVEVSELQ